ncbi:MAG: FAD:protein FMN transferase [Proteobacteria bacterium]|nr:FAD:protein FMN transferase [Pseudomonadota bacterium]
MISTSKISKRARPLLGTIVEIGVQDLPEEIAQQLISDAFAQIERIQCSMSRFDDRSEVTKVNGLSVNAQLVVSSDLWAVLDLAQDISRRSEGVFSICRDGEPKGDLLRLLDDGRVLRLRAGLIDLGGIAKGYAVDKAIECLKGRAAESAYVNAGGDIRTFGSPYPILVRHPLRPHESVASLDLVNAAFATSAAYQQHAAYNQSGIIVDPRSKKSVPAGTSASVMASTCVVADALTKCMLMMREESELLLSQFNARGFLVQGERVTSYSKTMDVMPNVAH